MKRFTVQVTGRVVTIVGMYICKGIISVAAQVPGLVTKFGMYICKRAISDTCHFAGTWTMR